ncbi:MAG: Na/Pi cotransporter family protein [Deltaproteobacteria bacterium]|nr:MAG: Na/Pi cotransporter family protein [Deltaproteobacteria bacterium]
MLLPFLLELPSPILASVAAQTSSTHWFLLVIGLLGGLALFLYGLEKMSEALKSSAGEKLRSVLQRMTQNRWAGLFTGTVVTGVTQSSSITTVLLVGFVSAGLLTMQQSVAVVMGSNVGTTITGQLAAFKLAQYTLLFVALGWIGSNWNPTQKMRRWGEAVLGLGLLFLGMELMSQAMKPLQSSPLFLKWMAQMHYAWLGILVGALFTALVQSSSATVGVIIALATQGLLDLKGGLAIALGANIGTCVTAVLASVKQNAETRQVAVVHVAFNVIGVLLFLPFLTPFAQLVAKFSPQAPHLNGLERVAYEAPRQIANAHTIFNLTCAFLFIGVTQWFAWLAMKLVPASKEEMEESDELRFMTSASLSDTGLALEMTRQEISRFGLRLISLLQLLPELHGDRPSSTIEKIRRLGGRLGYLHQNMSTWLTQLGHHTMSVAQTQEYLSLLRVINAYQNMATRITQDFLQLDWEGAARLHHKYKRDNSWMFHEIQERLEVSTLLTLRAVVSRDPEAAQQALNLRNQIDTYAQEAAVQSLEEMREQTEVHDSPAFLEIQTLELLKQLHYFNRRIARSQLSVLEEASKV